MTCPSLRADESDREAPFSIARPGWWPCPQTPDLDSLATDSHYRTTGYSRLHNQDDEYGIRGSSALGRRPPDCCRFARRGGLHASRHDWNRLHRRAWSIRHVCRRNKLDDLVFSGLSRWGKHAPLWLRTHLAVRPRCGTPHPVGARARVRIPTSPAADRSATSFSPSGGGARAATASAGLAGGRQLFAEPVDVRLGGGPGG